MPAGENREEVSDDVVSDGIFGSWESPLLSGRFFSNEDGPHTPPVAIISEEMARRFWPGGEPIGKRFRYGVPGENSDWHTVVGVVGHMLRNGVERRGMSQFYLSHRQKIVGPFPLFCSADRFRSAATGRCSAKRDPVARQRQCGWSTSRPQSSGFENSGRNGDSKPVCSVYLLSWPCCWRQSVSTE